MALRRPLVRSGGRTRQLGAGDTVAGVPLYASAYQAGGAALRINLATDYSLPVVQAGGATLNVQAVLNG